MLRLHRNHIVLVLQYFFHHQKLNRSQQESIFLKTSPV
jgi:hypothetical protein